MSDIFREVDEEVRRDRLIALAKRYGPMAIGVVLIVIIAIAVWQYRQHQREEALEASSARYEALVSTLTEQGQLPEGTSAGSLKAGYNALLDLRRAGVAVQQGETDKAVGIYDRLAKSGTDDPIIRDLATLQAARLLMDTAEPDTVIVRLEPLTGGNDTFAAAALELLAVLHIEMDDWTSAKGYLEQLGQIETPGFGVQQRASELLALVEAELDRRSQGGERDGAQEKSPNVKSGGKEPRE